MRDGMAVDEKFHLQEEEYRFPYHYLPNLKNGYFSLGRELSNGAGYLGYIMTYADYINRLMPKEYLDIGCGDGRIFEYIDPKIKRFGCDLSEVATCFGKAFNPEVDIRCVDVSAMPMESFDVISIIEVLEHIPDNNLSEFIKNAWATLRRSGHCIISVPTLNLQPVPQKHYRHYSMELLEEELKNAGIFYEINHVEWILMHDRKYKILLKLANNHLLRLEFLKQKLWDYTITSLIHTNANKGYHLFLDIIKK